jgi:hypothetical protein
MNMNSAPTIRIDRVKLFSDNTLQAFVDFTIVDLGMKINGSAVHSKSGERWIKFPSRGYTTPEGQKWQPLIWFESLEVRNAFNNAVLQALDRFVAAQREAEEEW